MVGKAEGKEEGKLEGQEEGRAQGQLEERAKTIRLLQGLLLTELTSIEELQTQSLKDLEGLIADLQLQLRNRIA